MPNHVHVLVTPKVVSTRWLGPLKGFTAYQANQRLGTHGQPFWQDESYDHVVRSQVEFDRVRAYIEENPVRAGLAGVAQEFCLVKRDEAPERRLRPRLAAPQFLTQ
jgi:REP element-mobilizing transposase RayT